MTLTVRPVPADYVAQAWPMVEGFIVKALKFSAGDYSMDQIRMAVASGSWLLLVAVDEDNKIHGAMTVSFINYPNDRVAFVTTTGGKGICSAESLGQMRDIVKSMGATKIQAGGRPAMVRLLSKLGFKQRYTVVESFA